MGRVIFTVDKKTVLMEVRRLTHYAGQRKQGDDGSFERISATESDSGILEQFWQAACDAATERLMRYATESGVEGEAYEIVMDMPSQYDTNLSDSIEGSLQNFFVNLIASKWLGYTDADGKSSAMAAAEALGYMQDAEKKISHRKRPRRFTN